MKTTKTIADKLTNKLTGFRSFGEFVTAMRDGYTPTIMPTTPGRRKLTAYVRSAGFRVFDGRRTA